MSASVSNARAPTQPSSISTPKWYDMLRERLVPPGFVVLFTFAVQYLAHRANSSVPFTWDRIYGNSYSWTVLAIFLLWSLIFLHVPAPVFKGPQTSFGYVPLYTDNGFSYYIITTVTYVGLHYVYPNLSKDVYDNLPYILGSCNLYAFFLCTVLLIMGKNWPQSDEKVAKAPILFEFYRGMEVHPRLFGVDVKQWTNCRIGMMAWQLLIVAFLIAGYQQAGVNPGHLTNVFLQTVYIAKFFWWETGYFDTLDITLDRAGYYICWGCLVWVPLFYTYSSNFLVAQPSLFSETTAVVIALLGIASVLMNYRIDYEKQVFRQTGGKCELWGRPARSIKVINQKTKKPSNLLVSGSWGVARHLNYTFEILAAFFWCLPGLGYGVWPFLYTIFLTGLLVHRVFRDEAKCADKYGPYWDEYCKMVRYRMIPFVF